MTVEFIIVRTVIAALIVAGFQFGVDGAGNLAIAWCWLFFLLSLGSHDDKSAEEYREMYPDIHSRTLSRKFITDLALCAAFIWYGQVLTALVLFAGICSFAAAITNALKGKDETKEAA